jgi:hypothetical protein
MINQRTHVQERTRVTEVTSGKTKIVAVRMPDPGRQAATWWEPVPDLLGTWASEEECFKALPNGSFILLKYEGNRCFYTYCEKGKNENQDLSELWQRD